MISIRILAVLAAATLVVACGDNGDNADGGPSPSPTGAPSGTASTTATPGSATGGTATPTTTNGDGEPSPTSEPYDTDATIELREFAIDPMRTAARPGSVTFHVRNTGELTHEFLVIRTDLHHAELPRLEDNQGADESRLNVIGRIENIQPGTEAETTLNMEVGKYVIICNLVTDSTSHYLSGMYDRFVISNEAPVPDAPTE